jgi:hypothetical protein
MNPPRTIDGLGVADHYADLAGEADHFLAFDSETGAEGGVVKLVTLGPDEGRWMWSMVLTNPGPAFGQHVLTVTITMQVERMKSVAPAQA